MRKTAISPIVGYFNVENNTFVCPGMPKGIHYETGLAAWRKHVLHQNVRLDILVKGVRRKIYVPLSETRIAGISEARDIEQLFIGVLFSRAQYQTELLSKYKQLAEDHEAGRGNPGELVSDLSVDFDDGEKGPVHLAHAAAVCAQRAHAQLALTQQVSQRIRAVYTVANALFLCDFSDASNPTGVLTIKVAQDRYIKLRGLSIRRGPVVDDSQWISLGNPGVFHISKASLNREIEAHNDPKRFGPLFNILGAITAFERNAKTEIVELAVQGSDDGRKLTTEMNSSNELVWVKRKFLCDGGCKRIYDESVSAQGLRIARGKVKKECANDRRCLDEIQAEIGMSKILQQCGVPHCTVAGTVGQDQTKIRLEMPLAEGGDFFELVKAEGVTSRVILRQRIRYLYQIAIALSKMHAAGYCHNDVKLENCFIKAGEALLGDLGTVVKIGTTIGCGSCPAPEYSVPIVETNCIAPASIQNDMWAFALVVYQMIYGFNRYNMTWLGGQKWILYGAQQIRVFLSSSSNVIDALIVKMLSLNPLERPPIQEMISCFEAELNASSP